MFHEKPVIFLDFDGPLMPIRGAYMAENYGQLHRKFDPIAVGFLNRIFDTYDVHLVISSTWRIKGKDEVFKLMKQNGLNYKKVIHPEEWCTPQVSLNKTRVREIMSWDGHDILFQDFEDMENHCQTYIDYKNVNDLNILVIDDEDLSYVLSDKIFVRADAKNGLTFECFERIIQILDGYKCHRKK